MTDTKPLLDGLIFIVFNLRFTVSHGNTYFRKRSDMIVSV